MVLVLEISGIGRAEASDDATLSAWGLGFRGSSVWDAEFKAKEFRQGVEL